MFDIKYCNDFKNPPRWSISLYNYIPCTFNVEYLGNNFKVSTYPHIVFTKEQQEEVTDKLREIIKNFFPINSNYADKCFYLSFPKDIDFIYEGLLTNLTAEERY